MPPVDSQPSASYLEEGTLNRSRWEPRTGWQKRRAHRRSVGNSDSTIREHNLRPHWRLGSIALRAQGKGWLQPDVPADIESAPAFAPTPCHSDLHPWPI